MPRFARWAAPVAMFTVASSISTPAHAEGSDGGGASDGGLPPLMGEWIMADPVRLTIFLVIMAFVIGLILLIRYADPAPESPRSKTGPRGSGGSSSGSSSSSSDGGSSAVAATMWVSGATGFGSVDGGSSHSSSDCGSSDSGGGGGSDGGGGGSDGGGGGSDGGGGF